MYHVFLAYCNRVAAARHFLSRLQMYLSKLAFLFSQSNQQCNLIFVMVLFSTWSSVENPRLNANPEDDQWRLEASSHCWSLVETALAFPDLYFWLWPRYGVTTSAGAHLSPFDWPYNIWQSLYITNLVSVEKHRHQTQTCLGLHLPIARRCHRLVAAVAVVLVVEIVLPLHQLRLLLNQLQHQPPPLLNL